MKEGNECYPMCGSFLLVNYTGYQNSRLVYKQQPADGAAPGRLVVARNLFKTTTTGIWLGHNIP